MQYCVFPRVQTCDEHNGKGQDELRRVQCHDPFFSVVWGIPTGVQPHLHISSGYECRYRVVFLSFGPFH